MSKKAENRMSKQEIENAALHDQGFLAISDWLIEGALGEINLEAQFLTFCRRLNDAGIPLMRAFP
jgi:hypothetical protein